MIKYIIFRVGLFLYGFHLQRIIRKNDWGRIKDGSWNTYVESLGNPPHVIKHDYLMKQMGGK